MTFDEALEKAQTKKHLLLGNGFSMALKPDIFSYGSLLEQADFSGIKRGRKLFETLATSDFESVVRRLNDTAKFIHLYPNIGSDITKQIQQDSALIKRILVDTIARRHRDNPNAITQTQYASCRKFLHHFDHIYTLNYDILLYWTLMQDSVDDLHIKKDDGFRSPTDIDATYVEWTSHHSPTVHYMHGALHLFDTGIDIIKYTWTRTDVPIVDQIRNALDEEKFPLIVSEGDSQSKQRKIIHNGYLHKSLRSLGSISGSIFTYGHSLDDNDDHIFKEIVAKGKVCSLFISLYGDPSSNSNQGIIRKAMDLIHQRESLIPSKPLSVEFYKAESASVWG